MKQFANVLDMHTYSWVPIVCFFVFLLFGMGIGFFKGWKRGLYFLVWDIIALILAIFATKPLLQTALKNVDTSNMPVDLKQFFFDHKTLMPIVMIGWFVALKPIAMLVRLPLAKALTLNDEHKTFTWRLLGAGISLVGAVPVTALSANAFTLISGKNFFSPVTDKLTYGLTFGQYDGISNDVTEVKATLKMGSDKELQNQVQDIFSGKQDVSQISDENKSTIQTFLNGNNLPLIVKNASGELKKQIDDIAANGFKGIQDQGANKFTVSSDKWENVSSILQKQYNWTPDTINALKENYLNVQ